MIGRLGLAAALIGLGFGAYIAGTRWQARRAGSGSAAGAVPARLRPGVPAVVYFWSETCAPCKLVQKPALDRLLADLGPDKVQVVAINALEQPAIADEWGVLSLPTTFIVDRAGQPRRVNHGVAPLERLHRQIAALNNT